MIIGGLFLVALPLFVGLKEGGFVAWIYGIPIFIIGLFVLFNKGEDKIEEIKNTKHIGGKKQWKS